MISGISPSFVICFLLTLLLVSQLSNAAEEIQQIFIKENELEVFVRDDCPHCAKAKKFLLEFGSERPWLRIVYRSVDHDVSARDDLMQYSQKAGVWPPGVPAFHFKDQLLVGFDNADHVGALLESLVNQTAADKETKRNQIETALFGTISVSHLGLPLFTLIMGLLDGLNPYAMWVLLFLLSMLVHLQDRKKWCLLPVFLF